MVSRPTHTNTGFPWTLLFLHLDLFSTPTPLSCLEGKDRGWLPSPIPTSSPPGLSAHPRGPGLQQCLVSHFHMLPHLTFAELAWLPRLTNRPPHLRRHAQCSGHAHHALLPCLLPSYSSLQLQPLTVLGLFLIPSVGPGPPLPEAPHLLLCRVSSCSLYVIPGHLFQSLS